MESSNGISEKMLNMIKPGCEVITLNQVTKGAADTVLKAKKFINNSEYKIMVKLLFFNLSYNNEIFIK